MTAFPDWLVPMAATLTQERFAGPEWRFERKYDGIRLIAFKHGDEVRLFSRNRLRQNWPDIESAIARLPVKDAILDGEITWDPSTRSARSGQAGPAYHVFDLLWLDGERVTNRSLEDRLALPSSWPGTRRAPTRCCTTRPGSGTGA